MEKIKVIIKAYDVKVLDESVRTIIYSVIKTGAEVIGPIALPTRLKRWAMNTSPHIDRRSMEHFEMRIHKRLVEIAKSNQQTIESLQTLQLPAGVSIELK